MSKLIEKIKHGTHAIPAPLGFRSMPAVEKPRMILIAAFSHVNNKNIAENSRGADAVVLHVSDLKTGMEGLSQISQMTPDVSWGILLQEVNWGEVKLIETTFDFAIFPPEMPLLALLAKPGKILEIEPEMMDSMIRSIDDLPVEAIFIDVKRNRPLDWRLLASLQRIDNLVAKPLIVKIPSEIEEEILLALWGVGVDGLVVEDGNGEETGKINKLRKMIDNTNFPLPRKFRKSEVILPFVKQAQSEEDEEE